MLPDQLEILKYWIKEREQIRLKKDDHMRKPWTTDPILQRFKFCNVHREHDRVTQWFAANWRAEKYWYHPNFVPAIMLGRTINWPNTLEVIGFPHQWEPETIVAKMDEIQESGKKVYSITPEGQKYLEDNKGAVEDIFERISDLGSTILSESVMEINRAFGRVARATYTTVPWQSGDKTVASELKRILEQAAAEIEELGRRKPA